MSHFLFIHVFLFVFCKSMHPVKKVNNTEHCACLKPLDFLSQRLNASCLSVKSIGKLKTTDCSEESSNVTVLTILNVSLVKNVCCDCQEFTM